MRALGQFLTVNRETVTSVSYSFIFRTTPSKRVKKDAYKAHCWNKSVCPTESVGNRNSMDPIKKSLNLSHQNVIVLVHL